MKLHDKLDVDELVRIYASDNRIRIRNILAPEIIDPLVKTLEDKNDYRYIFTRNGANMSLSPDEMASIPLDERNRFSKEMILSASKGEGFYYHGHRLQHCADPVLKSFERFLNSAEMFDFIKRVTGKNVSRADAQATLYKPGQFLTRHRDFFSDDPRELAFVFSFSRAWHPDWGGLLQFFEESGAPRDAWMPEMNVLSLFDTKHIHSVTYVTPFAQVGRLSITGWFY